MAAPSQINTLRADDFPRGLSERGQIDKLFQILNPFLQNVQTTTTAGTALQSNIDGQLAQVEITTPISDWIDLALVNNFAALDANNTPQYRVDANGQVWLRGTAKTTAGVASGTTMTTLPVFPAQYTRWATMKNVAGAFAVAQWDISTAGVMALVFGGGGAPVIDNASCALSFDPNPRVAGKYPCFPLNVRLKDGKKPVTVLCWAVNKKSNVVELASEPAWAALGTGATGNTLRIDNVTGLRLGQTYTLNFFIFF